MNCCVPLIPAGMRSTPMQAVQARAAWYRDFLVEVGGSDVEGIDLRLEPPADIAGHLEFDDDRAKEPSQLITGKTVERHVSLRDSTTLQKGASVAADNTFHVAKVPPGH